MKRLIVLLIVGIMCVHSAYAAEAKMFDMREKIFVVSQEIKNNIPKTKDSYAMMSMFNSCLMTVTQLDAYFHMIGIFDSVKKENSSPAAIDFLSSWLQQIQKTNQLNLNSIAILVSSVEPATNVYLEKVRTAFTNLDTLITEELNKVSALKGSFAGVSPGKTQAPKR